LEELAPVEIVGFAEDEPTATAWILANPLRCDLLVIDLFLKRGSGIEVLRKTATLTEVSKVIVSNYATPDMRRKCFELGANRVFDKSNEIEALVEYCTRFDAGEAGPGGL
jgi:DNA-binding NarL/FixJ family response regulator